MKVNVVGAVRIIKPGSVGFGHLFLEFLNGADALHFAAFAAPDGQRCTPVAFAGDGPVLDVAKPLAEPPFADPIGGPLNLVVKLEEVFFDRRHAHKPRVHGVVEQGVVGSPAVRVVVEVVFLSVE